MSVEYSANFGFGWVFAREERDAINEASNHRYEDDFLIVNAYSPKGPWFLGIDLGEVESGYAYEIGENLVRPELARDKLMNEFPYEKLKDMGFDDDQIALMHIWPKFYLLSRVY